MRIDALTLAPAVEHHLAEYGTDPAQFLEDRNVLWNMSFVSYEDNLTANYNWTEALEWRMTRDRLRWCFAAMMYFDLSKFLKPRRSCQLDANMVDRMRETLHITLETTWDRTGQYEGEAFAYLEKLDLRQKAEESGANELARNIRQYLIEPFENQMAVQE
ncbi:MAG: hypothetical protein Q9203_003527 [Teloschistes exilis]